MKREIDEKNLVYYATPKKKPTKKYSLTKLCRA